MASRPDHRAYLDWNASAPLRPEARAAMLSAMDEVGNPSSVHAEGRRARGIVERARAQVAALVGCETGEVVFTSGATEAAMLGLKDRGCAAAPVEHDCVLAWSEASLAVDGDGLIGQADGLATRQLANSETGVIQSAAWPVAFSDATQGLGKIPMRFSEMNAGALGLSAHKIGGPKGAGALIIGDGYDPEAPLDGGQEQGRRAGTENVAGLAGFGAAAEAAGRDLADGAWARVAALRSRLEATLEDAAPGLNIIGGNAPRLPNTACFAAPGWRGETQVMAMDLAGFAVSAGSACSSGKVEAASRVLLAMGFDETTAASAIRVSLGPTTSGAEVEAFADAWISAYRRWRRQAA